MAGCWRCDFVIRGKKRHIGSWNSDQLIHQPTRTEPRILDCAFRPESWQSSCRYPASPVDNRHGVNFVGFLICSTGVRSVDSAVIHQRARGDDSRHALLLTKEDLIVYYLELVGEEDLFAVAEAATAAAGVELLGPGLARAESLTDVGRLAYTRSAHERVERADATVEAAVTALRAAPLARTGTVAVRARDMRGSSGVSTARAERELGRVLTDQGFTVELDDPDNILRVVFAKGTVPRHDAVAGADGRDRSLSTIGWVTAESRRDFAPEPTDRPFFQPGSMASIDARAYANLAGAKPGAVFLDPMCGTGGLLIEAGRIGAEPIGIDAQQKMVTGAQKNTAALLPDAGPVIQGDATALPFGNGRVDALAMDVPYGRQSKIAHHDLEELVSSALHEAHRVAQRAVVIADRSWKTAADAAGWRLNAIFSRRVHRSLTRYVHVLE